MANPKQMHSWNSKTAFVIPCSESEFQTRVGVDLFCFSWRGLSFGWLIQEFILKLFPSLNTSEENSTVLPREARDKSIASIATDAPNCHDSLLQLGLITTISHCLQVSGLDNAGTSTRFNSKTICQAMVGLIIPLPSSQSITAQYDRGWTRILLAEVVWGFVGVFVAHCLYFHQEKIRVQHCFMHSLLKAFF